MPSVPNGADLRRRRLERHIADLTVLQPDDEMIAICAELRADAQRIGHPIGAKVHDGDRWIASGALRLGVPLVSHDQVFHGVPTLELLNLHDT